MAEKLSQTLDGIELNGLTLVDGLPMFESDNLGAFEVELKLDQDDPTARITTNVWTFSGGSRKYLLDLFDQGKTGSRSTFEGIELITKIQEGDESLEFKQLLLFAEAEWDNFTISIGAINLNSAEWLDTVADSVSIEYLYDIGRLTRTQNRIPIPPRS